MPVLLEIAADSLASALSAERAGAHRIELCAALVEGGLTPSAAAIAMAREQLRIPLHVLIRPRAGDFVYTAQELELMRRDIVHCRQLGCDGVVLGVLDGNAAVDVPAMRRLLGDAGEMAVTFHRAIDVVADSAAALEQVIALGCQRVLTSGGADHAVAGAATIAQHVRQADGRIRVMAGAGLSRANVAQLVAQTGVSEVHATARRRHSSPQRGVTGLAAAHWRVDQDEVRAMLAALAAR